MPGSDGRSGSRHRGKAEPFNSKTRMTEPSSMVTAKATESPRRKRDVSIPNTSATADACGSLSLALDDMPTSRAESADRSVINAARSWAAARSDLRRRTSLQNCRIVAPATATQKLDDVQ